MRTIIKENRFAPTFPGVYVDAVTGWQKRSTLSGYGEIYVEGSLATGWIWEAQSILTNYGIGYPFYANEQDFKDSCDRIAKPYSRPPEWSFSDAILQSLNIWVMCSATYKENGATKTNGLQPFKLTISSEQYKPTKFMTINDSNDLNIFDVRFSDVSLSDYNSDITKIKNFFAQCKRLNPVTPIFEYHPNDDSWSQFAASGGKTPMMMTLGDQIFFYATTNARITPEWGMWFANLNGKAVLPEVAVTL